MILSATILKGSESVSKEISVTIIRGYKTGQDASVVIGQPDFTTNTDGTELNQMNGPWGAPYIINNMLFIPEYTGDRILVYDAIPSVNGASAAFSIVAEGACGISGSADRLFIANYDDHQISVFNTIPTADGATNDFLLGDGTAEADIDSFYYPDGLIVVDNKLIVADSSNNRVLIWDPLPVDENDDPDIVLGQSDFDTSDPGTTAGTFDMNDYGYVWSDGTKLAVSDTYNNRVLIWNSFPTTNGQDADMVLGQNDFISSGDGTTQNTLYGPCGITSNGTQFFVADYDNYRVMIWNSFPTTNGQDADIVLGQNDFISSGDGTTQNTLYGPSGVSIYGTKLFVTDYKNHRVLIFE